jgi:hypothetical protein
LRSAQEFSGFDTQLSRQAIYYIDTGGVHAALKGAHVRAINAGAVG